MGRPVQLRSADIQKLARNLARKVAPFSPDLVVYLADGGQTVGCRMARILGVPARAIDMSYPFSRYYNRAPRMHKPLLWPLKELLYRFTNPRLNGLPFPKLARAKRIVLVDDSASSGKSLRLALDTLESAGVEPRLIEVAVIRAGRRAQSLVDHFEVEEPVLFLER